MNLIKKKQSFLYSFLTNRMDENLNRIKAHFWKQN